ncbi:MAG: coenzyme F420-0:L-glutamate ligase [Clostridiaceae bacterium]
MERTVGTTVRGLRAPIIRRGDDMTELVSEVVLNFLEAEHLQMADRDIVALTESIVARAQGNYASVTDIAEDVRSKTGGETCGVIFPILSRNRFAIVLKGIARGVKKIVLMLSYPADEVGNHLIQPDDLDASGVNPWTDVLSEAEFRAKFGAAKHTFTGVDYVDYYRQIIEAEGSDCEVIFANNPQSILDYTNVVINCDIHTRKRTKRMLLKAGARAVISLDEILNTATPDHGYNEDYGLLGSNKSTEEEVKLFPRDCSELVNKIQAKLFEKTGKMPEVMVYGDGAFKDPVGKIWELADPVVSPGFTKGLEGTPNEVKIKYLADNNFRDLSGEELRKAISNHISHKEDNLVGKMESQGTTPRQLTDLIGSLCDLTSGSGDKGTPIIYIQGYFDNFSN